MNTYKIHEMYIDKLDKKMLTIKNKCEKYGIDFSYEKLNEVFERLEDGYIHRFIEVLVNGRVHHENWEFLAKLERMPNDELYIKNHSDEDLNEFKNVNIICEHCNINRFRNNSFLMRNTETMEIKQLGKSCVKEYTDGLNADNIARYISYMEELEELEKLSRSSFSSTTYWYKTKEILAVAIAITNIFPYVKTSRLEGYHTIENEDSTKNYVLDLYCHINSKSTLRFKELKKIKIHDSLQTEANEIIDWALSVDDDSSFITNLKNVLNNEYCLIHDVGIIAYAPIAYKNYEERKRQEELLKLNKKKSQHVGELKEKLSFSIKSHEMVASYETQWGWTYVHKFTDNNDNVFIWKTGTSGQYDEDLILNGTVKEHSEYNDEKQTILTRCKIMKV